MGLNDTAEQLAVCHEVNVANEQEIARLRRENDALVADGIRVHQALEARLRHDAHGVAAVEAELQSARTRLAAITRLVRYIEDSEPLTAGLIRRILDEVTAEPWGHWLDLDEARTAEKACRHSAASIRTVLDLDPDRLHPDVAGYLPRLDTLADRLAS